MSTIKTLAAIGLTLACAAQAQAAQLSTAAGFGPGDITVTFDEVTLNNGDVVTNQYSGLGVTFSTDTTDPWRGGGTGYSSGYPNFAGNYLDNFTGAVGTASTYNILFSSTVDEAGAYFEFNISSPAAQFSAYLNGSLVDTFSYNNVSCCSSAEFIGFTGVQFNEIRVNGITGTHFIMDELHASPSSAVPEPDSLALLLAGAAVVGAWRRRRAVTA
jgi:hypothetical protein